MDAAQNVPTGSGISLTSSVLSGLWTSSVAVSLGASLDEKTTYPVESLGSNFNLNCYEDNDLLNADCEFLDDIVLSDCSINGCDDSWMEWFKQEIGSTVDGEESLEMINHSQNESNLQGSCLMTLPFMDLNQHDPRIAESIIGIPNFSDMDIVQPDQNHGDSYSPDLTCVNFDSPNEQGTMSSYDVNAVASFTDAAVRILAEFSRNSIDLSLTTSTRNSEVQSPPATTSINKKENQGRGKVGENQNVERKKKKKKKKRGNAASSNEIRRMRNLVSASKYRSKKKELETTILEKCTMLEVKNKQLKTEVKQLQKAVDFLKQLLIDVVAQR